MADPEEKIHWLEIKFQSDGEIAEALAEVLGRFVSGGVVVEAVTQFNPITQENEPTGDLAVFGYLPVDSMLECKKQKIEEALWHLNQISPIPQPKYSTIQEQDWMSAWKAHYSPISIGKKLLVLPAWQEPKPNEVRHVIRINPAMAFGTGTHPTTQLCMQLLENHLDNSQSVIDVGCGSGILSIAAIKLGASHVLAVDVDQQAIESTAENAGLNKIESDILEVGKGSIKEILSGQYSIQQAPFVMVNILAPIILRLFDQGMQKIVEKSGVLLLSGILNHQQQSILEAAHQAGFEIFEQLSDADWVSFAMKKL